MGKDGGVGDCGGGSGCGGGGGSGDAGGGNSGDGAGGVGGKQYIQSFWLVGSSS